MAYFMTSDIMAVLVAIAVVYIVQRLVKRYIRYRGYNLPPGPPGWPLLGYLGDSDHLALMNHKERYGDVSYMNILGTDIVVLNSITAIREALQGPTAKVFGARPDSFLKEYGIKPNKDIICRSMTEDNWKPLRQLLHSLLKQYGEGITQLENIVSQELEVVIAELDKKVGEPMDISEYLSASLINILSILAIGERYDYDNPKLQDIAEYYRIDLKLFEPSNDVVLKKFPLLRYLPFGPGALYKQYQIKRKLLIDNFFTRPKHLADNGTQSESDSRTGVVYEMIKKQKSTPWLSDVYIKGATINMFGAGFTTTIGSLRSFFLMLLHHPDIQRQIQAEIDDIIGVDRRPEVSDRVYMPYTMAAILEMTRYTSVVPVSVPHACTEDTTFRGYTVPRGAIILPNLFRVHHDGELWENPGNFDPCRFLDEHGVLLPANHPRRANLIAFGVGKRACMGEVFAKTRLFLYITTLLQTFTVKPAECLPSCDPRRMMMPGFVLGPVPYTSVGATARLFRQMRKKFKIG